MLSIVLNAQRPIVPLPFSPTRLGSTHILGVRAVTAGRARAPSAAATAAAAAACVIALATAAPSAARAICAPRRSFASIPTASRAARAAPSFATTAVAAPSCAPLAVVRLHLHLHLHLHPSRVLAVRCCCRHGMRVLRVVGMGRGS